jgi:hypothetical protein
MKLSERKQLQICNIIYANIASDFACMMNPRYRGQKFNWDGWIECMDRRVPIWLGMNLINDQNPAYVKFARASAKDFASDLVRSAHE